MFTLPWNYQKMETHNEKVNKAMVWLNQYADEFGDKMPDSKYVNLPSSLTKNDIFERMCSELEEQGEEPCGKNAFFKTWKKEFPHFVIPKVSLCKGSPATTKIILLILNFIEIY